LFDEVQTRKASSPFSFGYLEVLVRDARNSGRARGRGSRRVEGNGNL